LPEAIFRDQGFYEGIANDSSKIAWGNWRGETYQDWNQEAGRFVWQRPLDGFTFRATLEPDLHNSCLWYRYEFRNTSHTDVAGLNTQTCFHLVNAPEFISIRGERIWACLDQRWMTTDRVPRHKSPDPRRVLSSREGLRKSRNVVPIKGFPSALMPEKASHPLIISENFSATACVGIASRDYRGLFNNNDCILRCIHSEGIPIENTKPDEVAVQEGVIIFVEGDHEAAIDHYERITKDKWG